ncbi:pyridoxamine 5'-phosphate oxidase [Purpureocillium lilacinum]|uniref:pyridoxal 5'-phosphate synthase n=1 Tax=Purpureocillium lilacinum TaxID=33203 RepID=A0A2U3EAK6_PURLI|nr:pyridoxamine 5'-phosphate oxidase [Purpureocillium lilacinum]
MFPRTGGAAGLLKGTLSLTDLDQSSPILQFKNWFSIAKDEACIADPEVCTLSTAHLPSGRISSRVVQLKGISDEGEFVFFSNFGTSRKAIDLASNEHVALVFYWGALHRQVRVEGKGRLCDDDERQQYFSTTLRRSRLCSWASPQSAVLQPDGQVPEDDGRSQLDARAAETEKRFEDVDDVPMPSTWGVLRVVPGRIEFWQGRGERLHDRFVYIREGEVWKIERLSP